MKLYKSKNPTQNRLRIDKYDDDDDYCESPWTVVVTKIYEISNVLALNQATPQQLCRFDYLLSNDKPAQDRIIIKKQQNLEIDSFDNSQKCFCWSIVSAYSLYICY